MEARPVTALRNDALLSQWADEAGVVHLVHTDMGWMTLYCTMVPLAQFEQLERGMVPTCVRCIGLSIIDGWPWG